MPTPTELCFSHWHHDDVMSPTEGPHFVRPGGRAFSNFRAWREADAEIVQAQIRV